MKKVHLWNVSFRRVGKKMMELDKEEGLEAKRRGRGEFLSMGRSETRKRDVSGDTETGIGTDKGRE